jgi:hypothetical protein
VQALPACPAERRHSALRPVGHGRPLLTQLLADVAASNGVRTFVSYVLWENADALALLRAEGARIGAAEPGIARIEIDLPAPPTRFPTRRCTSCFAPSPTVSGTC